ncbi:hypothetical protein VB715_16905 [Crocosphaera sp. UHCC 0190]|uniref:hypothetical protein n=1 Tax=Crocosphaera sp. UHCC 0190 TaxID=3110246 RepID=UPI002B1FB19D|nr:hypothetical protein [Crocosphaera sp. UHCC 0190]MEA5511454.1 hypothetical protein [Crocosphaera sp. UHCC 0190]
MTIKWKILISKLAVWIMIEIILNCLGLDNLADYGEFVQKRYPLLISFPVQVMLKS